MRDCNYQSHGARIRVRGLAVISTSSARERTAASSLLHLGTPVALSQLESLGRDDAPELVRQRQLDLQSPGQAAPGQSGLSPPPGNDAALSLPSLHTHNRGPADIGARHTQTQVEYALEAVKQGSACVGLRSKTHVILLGLKVRPATKPVLPPRRLTPDWPYSDQQESWRRTRRSSSGSTITSESASPASLQTHAFSRQSGLYFPTVPVLRRVS